MEVEVDIREAGESDLFAILALHSGLEIDKQADALSFERAKEIYKKIGLYPNYKIFVASIDEKVIGTFALLIMDNLAHNGSPSGIIEDVVVAVNMQNKGIGKAMMQFAMEKCREQGCYKAILSSNQNRLRAHQFYESLGFVRHGYSFSITL